MKNNNNYWLFAFCSLFFVPVAHGAGTYYNGTYQSPQQRYSTTGYYDQNSYNNYYSRYQPQYQQQIQQPAATQQKKSDSNQTGFYLSGGASHETAMWRFDMNDSKSILHYDNVEWNIFDVNAGYKFNMGSTPGQVDLGLKMGMQSGNSTMVDDDITDGGYFITQWIDSGTGDVIGDQIGHALSVGTSNGGSMLGFNVGFGLTDFFKWGNAKITPSIGYRSLNYKLETNNNYGLSVDTSNCFTLPTGEIQCDAAIVVHYSDGSSQILWRDTITSPMEIVGTADPVSVDTGGTYYYQQPGTSHSYDVTWAGPYAAVDVRYDINKNNSVNGRVELGLPSYTATGDQPYRSDWQHPKSVEDTAGMGSAMHLGFLANWNTSLTDYIMLSFGLTYDYYSVSGADAKTYLNQNYYMTIYDNILAGGVVDGVDWGTGYATEADMLDPTTGSQTAINIKSLETTCPGWVCTAKNEVNSLYKSMGIRVGLNAKF